VLIQRVQTLIFKFQATFNVKVFMKTDIKILFILLAATLITACTVKPKNKVPGEYIAGQAKFHEVCANCHGPDAMGGNKAPKLIQRKFITSNYSNKRIARTIINGSSSAAMPSQKRKVSEEEIHEIIKYLRYSQKDAGLT
jgi:mono/diheme cytochrome c family protein